MSPVQLTVAGEEWSQARISRLPVKWLDPLNAAAARRHLDEDWRELKGWPRR